MWGDSEYLDCSCFKLSGGTLLAKSQCLSVDLILARSVVGDQHMELIEELKKWLQK